MMESAQGVDKTASQSIMRNKNHNRSLKKKGKKEEIKELDPLDESFDPEKHQAMTTEYVEGKPAGVVVKVFQKGYLLHERLVRPALVVVSSEKPEKSS